MKHIVVLVLILSGCGLSNYKLYDQRCTFECMAVWKDKCIAGEYNHWESIGKRYVIKCNCYMEDGNINWIFIKKRPKGF